MNRFNSDWSPERISALLSWIEKRTPETVTLNANDFSSLMLYCEQLQKSEGTTLLMENEKLKQTIAVQAKKIRMISQAPGKAKRLAVAIARIHSYADEALKTSEPKVSL
ncbi:hypothetical protein [Mixta sp. Marseille-Q2659]|uniref:hypothetical protein n=1 Tax=Mixta sp. Marseille-Q2659 TaxID=2736607 RepID=UPI0023B90871|nr:hypothetical protein [Mixta sp. Marseille-Q2659]